MAPTWAEAKINPLPGARARACDKGLDCIELIGKVAHRLFRLLASTLNPVEQVMIGEVPPFGAALPFGAIERAIGRTQAPGPIEPGKGNVDVLNPAPEGVKTLGETFGQVLGAGRDPCVVHVGRLLAPTGQAQRPGDMAMGQARTLRRLGRGDEVFRRIGEFARLLERASVPRADLGHVGLHFDGLAQVRKRALRLAGVKQQLAQQRDHA